MMLECTGGLTIGPMGPEGPPVRNICFRERVPGRPQQLLLQLGPTYTCISHNDNKDFAITMIDPTFHILRPRSANRNPSVDTE